MEPGDALPLGAGHFGQRCCVAGRIDFVMCALPDAEMATLMGWVRRRESGRGVTLIALVTAACDEFGKWCA
jgi:hypothetical protein